MRSLTIFGVVIALAIAESYEIRQYQLQGPDAPLSSDGMVMETPEVAQARAAHLAMHAEVMARLKKAQQGKDDETFEDNELMAVQPKNEPMMEPMPKHQRSLAAPLDSDGRVMDTPEVAEAKAAHMAAHARAAKAAEFYELDLFNGRRNLVYLAPLRVTYKNINPLGYQGPFAPLGPDGRVIDTPEVTRAREAHMKAHARAVALTMQNDNYY